MHIIIAFLTAFAGVIWALYRLQNSGVDLNSFNPFFWARRRAWEKKLGTKPLHQIESPMEAAAVLVVAITKLEGEVSREQKQDVIKSFVSEFQVSESKATELYSSSAFLLNDVSNFITEVKNILAPSRSQFDRDKIYSVLSLLDKAAQFDGHISEVQQKFITEVENQFKGTESGGQW